MSLDERDGAAHSQRLNLRASRREGTTVTVLPPVAPEPDPIDLHPTVAPLLAAKVAAWAALDALDGADFSPAARALGAAAQRASAAYSAAYLTAQTSARAARRAS